MKRSPSEAIFGDQGSIGVAQGSFRADPPPALRAGRLVVDLLYEREAPRAVANFKALCTGEKGLDKASKKPLHYQACTLLCLSHPTRTCARPANEPAYKASFTLYLQRSITQQC